MSTAGFKDIKSEKSAIISFKSLRKWVYGLTVEWTINYTVVGELFKSIYLQKIC